MKNNKDNIESVKLTKEEKSTIDRITKSKENKILNNTLVKK